MSAVDAMVLAMVAVAVFLVAVFLAPLAGLLIAIATAVT